MGCRMPIKNEFKKPFIANDYLIDIQNMFDRLRLVNKQFGKVDCALITGESGVGKSQLIKQYCKNNPPVRSLEKDTISTLRISLRKINSDEELLRAILARLGKPPSKKKNKPYEDLLKDLILTVKNVELEILFLDEVQRLMQKRSQHVVQSINDTFKELIDELNIPIVFIGMPWLKHMIRSSSQLYERISYERPIPVHRLTTSSFKDFIILLHKFSRFYGFDDDFKVNDSKVAWRFYAATGGFMRRISNLFQSAYILKETGSKLSGLNLFAAVIEDNKKMAFLHNLNQPLKKSDTKCEEKKAEICQFNPFTAPLTKLKLYEMILREDFQFGSRAFKNQIGKAEYIVWIITSNNQLKREKKQSVTC